MRYFLIVTFLMIFTHVFVPAHAASLRQNAIISDQTIKLGDVFSGLDSKAERVLGPAPLPGRDMVLNARTLLRIALAMDLNWRPSSSHDKITLRRSATIVEQETIENSLKDALGREGLHDSFAISFDQTVNPIILPPSEIAQIEVEHMTYRPEKKWFEATIVAPSRENPHYTSRISGKIHRLVEIPVLRDALRKGSIIGAGDIDFISVKDYAVKPHMILDGDALIGMTPRSVITPGNPIRENDIERPEIVSRGQSVTMLFKDGLLSLTARGKALENGSQGDLIRIMNTASNKSIEARVTGHNEVTIEHYAIN